MIPGRHRRLLLSLVVLTCLVVMGGAGSLANPAPAVAAHVDLTPGADSSQAEALPDRVLVEPTTITPAVVDRTTPISITGSVTARTGVPLSGARVRVVAQPGDLTERSAVTSWASSRGPARGTVLAETALPSVAAGQTTSFALTIPPRRVSSTQAFAALPISIEVVPRTGSAPSGVVHTFLAWNSRKEFVPMRVATLLPLTLGPDLDLFSRDPAKRDAAWTAALGPGSRIARILEGSSGSQTTLAVDPSLLGPHVESPATAPGGTQTTPTAPSTSVSPPATPSATGGVSPPTQTASSTPTPTGSPDTEDNGAAPPDSAIVPLIEELTAELRGRNVWALPYADADLAAAVDVAPTNAMIRELVNRATELGKTLGTSVRSNAFWPVDGTLTAARDTALRSLVSGTPQQRVGAVVVSQDAITVASPYTPSAVRATPTGTRLLAFDDSLSALLPRRGGSAALATQRFLAESLVLLGERPGTERSILLAAPRDYDPDAVGLATFLKAVESAGWLAPVPADALIEHSDGRAPLLQQNPRPVPAPIAPPPVLTAKRLAAIATQHQTLLAVATVLRDGAAFRATYREMLDELTSSRWRSAPAAWQSLNDAVVADTKAATSAIKVVPQGVNFLAAHGILRITVENGLDYTVEGIRLVVEPTNPRMTVEQPEPITIGPGAKTTVRVPATAVAAGRVDIQAYLTTADGTPIGQPATMRVSANPLDSTFYWTGAILVGLVLLFGVIRTVRRGTSRVEEIGDLETVVAEVERRERSDEA